jgi:hypothetical protein
VKNHLLRTAIIILDALSLIFVSSVSSFASAGWSPTHPGDIFPVEFCIPSGAKSPVYLQVMEPDKASARTLATIHFSHLKQSDGCRQIMKNGLHGSQIGPYDLIYSWRVNISGEHALQLYAPNLHKYFYGFPDGINSK